MEAEALTTDTWSMQDAPENASAVPDTLNDNREQPDRTERTFRDVGVAEPICAALEAAGISTAFPIQALALPIALDGHDLIGQARTGTGKTLAFGIPILQQLDESPGGRRSAPRALVVVPTRELAIQVADDLRIAGSRLGTSVVTVYGGRAYEPQIEALATSDLVVGTPGRLLDLIRQGHLDLSDVHGLVLDEADKMLDLGFLPDVEKILRRTPVPRQTMLCSPTMPGEEVTLARRHLRRPTRARAEDHDVAALGPGTDQPDRAGRAHRRGGDLRGLAGPATLEAHRRHPGPRPSRARRDVLHIRAPVQRATDIAGYHRNAAGRHARPTRPGGRGSRGHRGDGT